MQVGSFEANRWEDGCKGDVVRNEFIVPNMSRLLNLHKPATILDIGAGTGYVPRIVDGCLSYRPTWTLLDTNTFRLAVAEQRKGLLMDAHTVLADIFEHEFANPFAAILATFTLLEIDMDRLIKRLPALVADHGLLLLSLPDAWRDVLTHGKTRPELIDEFLLGRTSIPKVDKFPQQPYPFQAVRLERLISKVLAMGFQLFELVESAEDQSKVYILAFQRGVSVL